MSLNYKVSIASLMILFVMTITPLTSQSWEFYKIDNPFDGETLVAYVIGKSSNELYDKPILAILKSENKEGISISFQELGYTGNISTLSYVFDEGEVIKLGYQNLFVGDSGILLTLGEREDQFLKLLGEKSKLSVRFHKNGDVNYDTSFSLRGSSNAIAKVLGTSLNNYLIESKKKLEANRKLLEEKEKEIEKQKLEKRNQEAEEIADEYFEENFAKPINLIITAVKEDTILIEDESEYSTNLEIAKDYNDIEYLIRFLNHNLVKPRYRKEILKILVDNEFMPKYFKNLDSLVVIKRWEKYELKIKDLLAEVNMQENESNKIIIGFKSQL